MMTCVRVPCCLWLLRWFFLLDTGDCLNDRGTILRHFFESLLLFFFVSHSPHLAECNCLSCKLLLRGILFFLTRSSFNLRVTCRILLINIVCRHQRRVVKLKRIEFARTITDDWLRSLPVHHKFIDFALFGSFFHDLRKLDESWRALKSELNRSENLNCKHDRCTFFRLKNSALICNDMKDCIVAHWLVQKWDVDCGW